jgi:hypothetical protein
VEEEVVVLILEVQYHLVLQVELEEEGLVQQHQEMELQELLILEVVGVQLMGEHLVLVEKELL